MPTGGYISGACGVGPITEVGLPHDGTYSSFFFNYISIKQDSNYIMAGWIECSWLPDKQFAAEYDSKQNKWNIFTQYDLSTYVSGNPFAQFVIAYQSKNTWTVQLSLSNPSVLPSKLSTVHINITASASTTFEKGIIMFSASNNWPSVPATLVTGTSLTYPYYGQNEYAQSSYATPAGTYEQYAWSLTTGTTHTSGQLCTAANS